MTGARILILGGTGYIGPYFVSAARARGHEVTLFNRGNSGHRVPADIDVRVGDREGDFASLDGDAWDATIDLGVRLPRWVKRLAKALGPRVGHYSFISTISVYDFDAIDGVVTEGSALHRYNGSDAFALDSNAGLYGPLKHVAEVEAEQSFPGRALILRPGYIVGRGDHQPAFAFWAERVRRGGRTLALGDPASPVQFVDVRDLAEWTIRCIEADLTGRFNVVGPEAPLELAHFITGMADAPPAGPDLVWADPASLAEAVAHPIWRPQLFWSELPGGFAGVMRVDSGRALHAGMTFRPLRETAAWLLDDQNAGAASPVERFADWTWAEYLAAEESALNRLG
ncbi:NAD-dependent epimerase/dehydratase family protein [Sphingomonas sp.]|uniref:NAD-dependent epimerase/dehydratase family protein n=1 Tax=Sphingomonas sp. TaxID=28214 RepID=UPI002DD62388|nr:NAD-dependent epimerase/dehydratase family protein [Sphingomonas sp.]